MKITDQNAINAMADNLMDSINRHENMLMVEFLDHYADIMTTAQIQRAHLLMALQQNLNIGTHYEKRS